MKKLLTYIVSVIAVLIVYGIVNLVLVGGQSLWNKEDKERLETLKVELEDSKKPIERQEEELIDLEEELAALEEELGIYENEYPDGIHGEYYQDYVKLIDKHNTKLIVYEERYRVYNGKVYRFNINVEEANELAEKVGSNWYLVPMPSGRN